MYQTGRKQASMHKVQACTRQAQNMQTIACTRQGRNNQTHAQNHHETCRTPAPFNTVSERACLLPASTKSRPLHGDGGTRMQTRAHAQHGKLQWQARHVWRLITRLWQRCVQRRCIVCGAATSSSLDPAGRRHKPHPSPLPDQNCISVLKECILVLFFSKILNG